MSAATAAESRTHSRASPRPPSSWASTATGSFPIDGQHRIARGIRTTLDGDRAVVLASDFGHDGFLIETPAVGAHLRRLLESPAR